MSDANERTHPQVLHAIRIALAELPRECKYHGDNLVRDDGWGRQYCCDSGRPALRRRMAEQAIDSIEARL